MNRFCVKDIVFHLSLGIGTVKSVSDDHDHMGQNKYPVRVAFYHEKRQFYKHFSHNGTSSDFEKYPILFSSLEELKQKANDNIKQMEEHYAQKIRARKKDRVQS